MQKSASKAEAKEFAKKAIQRKPDKVSIHDIVYLDEDLYTYKYFMTGEFDEAARKQAILAQQAEAQRAQNEEVESEQSRSPERDHSANSNTTPFFNKLVALNDKIHVFKNQFYNRQPKQQMNYDHILRDKRLSFSTFK